MPLKILFNSTIIVCDRNISLAKFFCLIFNYIIIFTKSTHADRMKVTNILMAFSTEIADKQILIEQGQKQNFNLFTPHPNPVSNTTNKKALVRTSLKQSLKGALT